MPFVYSSLLAISLVVAGILYYTFWQPPWLIYPAKTITPLASIVAPGQTLPMYVERVSTEKAIRNYTSTRELHCDSLKKPVALTPASLSVEPGASYKISNSLEIPLQVIDDEEAPPRPMPPGRCYVAGSAEIQGLIRTIQVPWRTAQFTVTTAPAFR